MLAMSRLGKISVRVARTCIEVMVVAVGWLLGGPAWLGTLIVAIAIGPAVQFAFKVLGVHQAATPHFSLVSSQKKNCNNKHRSH